MIIANCFAHSEDPGVSSSVMKRRKRTNENEGGNKPSQRVAGSVPLSDAPPCSSGNIVLV